MRDRVQNPLDNEPTQWAIHIISGGETLAGDSSSSWKAYARLAYQVNYVGEITFTLNDQGDVILPHDDPMVISVVIAKHPIEKIIVDNGSSINLIYWNCFEQMSITHNQLKRASLPLYSFTGETVLVVGSIRLPITMGFGP